MWAPFSLWCAHWQAWLVALEMWKSQLRWAPLSIRSHGYAEMGMWCQALLLIRGLEVAGVYWHRQHRAGRAQLVDLDTQRVSDVGENRIQQSGTSTPRISNFRDDLIRITESPRGSGFAQTRAERGRFLPTLQPCSPVIGGKQLLSFLQVKAVCCNP